MSEQLLNTRDAARYLGVSMSFLEKDRWAGARIPFVRVGSRAIRYRRADIDAYIAGQVRRSTSDPGCRRDG